MIKRMPGIAIPALAIALLPGYVVSAEVSHTAGESAQQAFMQAFQPYCGKAFAARIVQDSAPSPDWQHPLVVHIRDCEEGIIRMPLHVGENRSRTWVLSQQVGYIDFQHIHLHEDGSADAVSPYGGRTLEAGTPTSQSFPVNEASQALFLANGLDASITNVWSLGFPESKVMSYTLSRPGRIFEVQVDLNQEIPLPPPAWGYAD